MTHSIAIQHSLLSEAIFELIVGMTRGLYRLARLFEQAQMARALYNMSDAQLASLDIKRSEVPAKAFEFLNKA